MAAQAEPSPQAPNAALLVDFDNVTMGIRSDLQTQLRKLLNSDIIRGKVSVQRAYADWRRYPQYIVPLTEASIDLIFAPAVGANKKNATDIRLAIDALELVFTRPEIGTFILLSGDSDFSALVLKLKEYGKFVIGVGIRESSSDLLVQNCDEYYSYNEITGLARTGDEEIVRHDPWELVVEAVQKMLESGDVMRSDRLKQVMQSIDPNFDEKDAGCNRFSKFVLEAEKRGLLQLSKMENGQYAVDVGPNANVPVEQQQAAEAKPKDAATAPSTSRRKRSTRPRADRDTKERTLTLSESFDLLKRTLKAAGAVGEEATVADRARDGMIEIHGNDADPVFEVKRFQRMLRQAHDADVIELIKSEGDAYMLKLSASANAEMEKSKAGVELQADVADMQKAETEQGEDAEGAEKAKTTTKRKTTKKTTARKSPRSRVRAAAKEGVEEDSEPADKTGSEAVTEAKVSGDVATETSEKPKKTTKRKTTKRKTTAKAKKSAEDAVADEAAEEKPKKTTKRKTTKRKSTRVKKSEEKDAEDDATSADIPQEPKATAPIVNPRFRRGARSAKPRPAPEDTPSESAKQEESPPPPTPSPAVSTAPRTLGMRSGSRRSRQTAKKTPLGEEDTAQKDVVQPEPDPKPMIEREPIRQEEPKATEPEIVKKTEPAQSPEVSSDSEEEESGLFRKVTAAFQRAMGTAKEHDK
jgi:uncharacterized protein (TIGR00288 family)